jgi:hypothetical protein
MEVMSSLVGSADYVSVIDISEFEFVWNLVLVLWILSKDADKNNG